MERWANEGKLILVAALDGTFQRQPFLTVLQLVPLAEDVTKLKAVCAHCHREAAFTHRKSTEAAVEVSPLFLYGEHLAVKEESRHIHTYIHRFSVRSDFE